MHKLFFLIIIFALPIECHFQEPIITATLQKKESLFYSEIKNIDAYTLRKANTIIQDISNNKNSDQSEKISQISEKFLGTPYQSNMLVGSDITPEKLIIDFKGLDCFTYLDYVIALHMSLSQNDFIHKVIKTRYIDEKVSFYNRKHFFTDWADRECKIAEDITTQLSPHTLKCVKLLNQKDKDQKYLPGIPVISRNINYIPSSAIDMTLISKLKSGDLIGIYTPLAGLDVSHVGLFIATEQGPVFRHASSSKDNRRVVDTPFMPYLLKTPGIIVLRTKPSLLQ
ncbi:DUF1460 domain-containing protein [uncultured Cedecea sp.]|uniref:DUF1460 domain-containing protein n=1 Tax=uncultured Cedecea sp. TaxID=988762 RepID=UPI00260725D0|nr:DUF1460 domain-containing protein [uncultured Cedecea sp.]